MQQSELNNDDKTTKNSTPPLEAVREYLVGSAISRFGVGDTWELYFSGVWLVAQDIVVTEEDAVNQMFSRRFRFYHDAVDSEYISKSAVLAAHMRKTVVAVTMDGTCSLVIEFENGGRLTVPTDANVVDWQWCLNTSGKDPYSDYFIACFWTGKVECNIPGR